MGLGFDSGFSRWDHGFANTSAYFLALCPGKFPLGFGSRHLGYLIFIDLSQSTPANLSEITLQYFTAYVVEKLLSIDNLFVIYLIFQELALPLKSQKKVLLVGILSAFILRSFFITTGIFLIQKLSWLLWVFGMLLLWMGLKLLRPEQPENSSSPNKFWQRLIHNRWLPTEFSEKNHFFIRVKDRIKLTAVFWALVAVESADIVFAIDSVPAVLAITQDPYVAISSNVMAVLGLRALFFLIESLTHRLSYLKIGLGIILIWIGFKLIIQKWWHVPPAFSLILIITILILTILASIGRKNS